MTTTPIRSDWVGRIIDGRFTLQEWLGGSDGSGVFLTGLDGNSLAKAAIKLISVDAVDMPRQTAAWAAAKTLSHPHLVRIFDAGRCEIDTVQLLYVVTEYAGEVLSEILPERPLTPAETADMLAPVLDALACLHGNGLVHSRIKPSNLLVVDDRLKLSTDRLLLAGSAAESPSVPEIRVAPELSAGTISPAADIWSLGVTLVEALTQHLPVWDASAPKAPVVPSTLPQPFLGIARACLRLVPGDRCTLEEIKGSLRPGQTSPETVSDASPVRSSKRLMIALVVVAALALVAVVAAVMMRSHPTAPTSSAELEPAPSSNAPAPDSGPQKPSASHAASNSPAQPVSQTNPSAQTPPEAQAAYSAQEPSTPSTPTEGGTQKGTVTDRVLPDLLPAAKASIHGGFGLTVRVKVNDAGEVADASLDVPGPSRYFANQSLEAARHWKFKPPQANGRPVASVWTLEFRFTQEGTEIVPIEVSP